MKIDQIEKFGLSKKAAVVSNFCLIGKIRHNFLVPSKTFMPIQTLGLHRVIGRLIFECQFLNFPTQKYNAGKSLQSKKLLLCQFRIHAGVPGDTMQYYTTGSRSI